MTNRIDNITVVSEFRIEKRYEDIYDGLDRVISRVVANKWAIYRCDGDLFYVFFKDYNYITFDKFVVIILILDDDSIIMCKIFREKGGVNYEI